MGRATSYVNDKAAVPAREVHVLANLHVIRLTFVGTGRTVHVRTGRLKPATMNVRKPGHRKASVFRVHVVCGLAKMGSR